MRHGSVRVTIYSEVEQRTITGDMEMAFSEMWIDKRGSQPPTNPIPLSPLDS